ncbi:MAG: hypothetical protein COA44_05585 [Arcobacter sp.]|nr:MAG: hypothetical protein COA44_05585 [Arcobacter sp.]
MESVLLHPPLVHFAIVLPFIALVFQLAFSVTNTYTYSQWSARTLMLSALIMIAAWYTGGLEGTDAYPLLAEAGQETLKSHKSLGLYIMVATIIIALVKFVACKSRNVILETLVFISLLGLSSTLAYQGLLGGEIVYKHGANVVDHSDGLDCLEDPSDFIDE